MLTAPLARKDRLSISTTPEVAVMLPLAVRVATLAVTAPSVRAPMF